MARLIAPDAGWREAFLDAWDEFGDRACQALGSWRHRDGTAYLREEMADPSGFAGLIEELRTQALEGSPRMRHLVPATSLWWVEERDLIGRVQIRHRLSEELWAWGGHIGYAVRPAARCQGHATAMLAAALPTAYRLGLDPVLITCDLDNPASRKVIEANGGKYFRTANGKLHYWVRTCASPVPDLPGGSAATPG